MSEPQTLAQRWHQYRASKATLRGSCAGCVIATVVVGFLWGGWVTGGTAAAMAAKSAEAARTDLAAAVCIGQFESSPDAAAKLAALKKTDSWQRVDFIRKGGWATMPGAKDPMSDAAGPCAEKLLAAPASPTASAGSTGSHG